MTINGRSKSVPTLDQKKAQNGSKLPEIDPKVLEENARIAAEFNDFNSNGGIVRDCYIRKEASNHPITTK